MNINTHNAPQLNKTLAALVSILLLAAAGPVYSAVGSDELQLACQGTTSCGS